MVRGTIAGCLCVLLLTGCDADTGTRPLDRRGDSDRRQNPGAGAASEAFSAGAGGESSRSESWLSSAQRELDAGRLDRAEALLKQALVAGKESCRIKMLYGQVLHRQGRVERARQWILETAETCGDAADAIRCFQQGFTWSLETGDWDAAEQAARRMIQRFPDSVSGHRLLAQLTSSQGRRQESAEAVRRIVKLEAADQRELLSLVDISGPFQLVSFQPFLADHDRGLFLLGEARRDYIADADVEGALERLGELPPDLRQHPAASAFYGRVLAETRRDAEFVRWQQSVSSAVGQQSEYWLALGTWLQHSGRDRESVAALARAVRINPTDRKALRLMAGALSRIGQTERADAVQATLSKLDTVFRTAAGADAAEAFQIGVTMQELLRPWEALGWFRLARRQGGGAPAAEDLQRRASEIRDWEAGLSPEQLETARTRKLLAFDPADYPLPENIQRNVARRPNDVSEEPAPTAERDPLVFRDRAPESGVRTSFVSGYDTQQVDFYLHQANGGGLALLDFDRDGALDLYVVQSGGDPNRQSDSAPNELYRQTDRLQFGQCAGLADVDDRGFGQGVCAADVNQDGFVDLLVANIGRNRLLINQGDGTFRDATESHLPPAAPSPAAQWTSSMAVGDLDGDQLPDLIEVNYVDDPLVFQTKCRGEVIACVPQDFRAAADRFLKLTPTGRFETASWTDDGLAPRNYGFGVVIANFDDSPGNEVFVGNDGDLNHFWRSSGDTGRQFSLLESANASGIAVGASGSGEACMGVAAGDFDRDRRLDLAVTNFYREPMNLFLQTRDGAFTDEALRWGLDAPSRPLLGFGCQAGDFDNDGWLDLAVLNGHLYDYSHQGIPFRMKPQLYRGLPGGFDVQTETASDSYFSEPRLGRTLAAGDLDGDGRIDLVANHLDRPVALLMNRSEAGRWIEIELVGRFSDRDAVGAVAELRCGEQIWVAWQTGGDGYMCTNEPVLHVGLGDYRRVDSLTVRWPGGTTQTLTGLAADRRHLVIEPPQPSSRNASDP